MQSSLSLYPISCNKQKDQFDLSSIDIVDFTTVEIPQNGSVEELNLENVTIEKTEEIFRLPKPSQDTPSNYLETLKNRFSAGLKEYIENPPIFINEKEFQAEADFNINRTDWGITYGNDQSLGDKFIKPEVNIKLNIKS